MNNITTDEYKCQEKPYTQPTETERPIPYTKLNPTYSFALDPKDDIVMHHINLASISRIHRERYISNLTYGGRLHSIYQRLKGFTNESEWFHKVLCNHKVDCNLDLNSLTPLELVCLHEYIKNIIF